MLLKNLSLYGGLLLLCQLVLSCSAENNSSGGEEAPTQLSKNADDKTGDDANISSPTKQILVYGDSLFAGYKLGPKEGLVPSLQDALSSEGYAVNLRSAAVSGDTSAGGLRRLKFVLDGGDDDIDLVILGLGGNDMLRGISPTETRANLTAMMDEFKSRDIDILLTGMVAAPNLGASFAREFNSIYPDLAKKYDAGLYPFIMDGVITDSSLMLSDNIHPNAKGVKKITGKLLPFVSDRLKTDE